MRISTLSPFIQLATAAALAVQSSAPRALAGRPQDNILARRFTDLCWLAVSYNSEPCLVGRDVEIRSSGGGKGRGVFAVRAIPAGTFLTRYTGDLQKATDYSKGPASAYACDLGKHWAIDAADSPHARWAHILNHSRRKQNCDFFLSGLPERAADLLHAAKLPTDPFALWYETTRDIAPGEELCTDYGVGYWDDRICAGLHNAAPTLAPLWRLHPSRLAVDYWL